MMATTIILIVVGIFLLLIGVLDILFRKVPSILLDSFLLIAISLNPSHLFLGIYSFIFAYTLYDLGLFEGIGDIKLIAALGLFANSMAAIWLFIGLICFLGIFWKMIYKKYGKTKTCPFIPVIIIAGVAVL